MFIRLSLEHLFIRQNPSSFLSLSFLIRLLSHTDEISIHESVELRPVLWMQITPPGGSLFFLFLVSKERKDKLEWRRYVLINLHHSSFLLAMNANRLIRRESADSEFTIRSKIFLVDNYCLLNYRRTRHYYLFLDNTIFVLTKCFTFERRNQCRFHNRIQEITYRKLYISPSSQNRRIKKKNFKLVDFKLC